MSTTSATQAPGPQIPPALAALGRVHFLGLAGVGVSAIARLMLAAGVPISGTDAKDLPVLQEFRDAGVPVRVGYSAQNLASIEAETGEPVTTVIASSIAKEGNPEYDAARAAGAAILHRSQGLAACMADQQAIAVAGTHGKTTTSSMTAVMLDRAGVQPSFAIGANVAGFGTNAQAGAGQWFVAEADESDGSLLNYRPRIAVITNVEPDHLDHYGTAEAVEQVFVDFTERIEAGGTLVICADDDGAAALLEKVRESLAARDVQILSYGTGESADIQLNELVPAGTGLEAVLRYADQSARLQLKVPGVHNALNAAAAVGAGLASGLTLEQAAAAVAEFSGSSRRFELRGEVAGIRVYDDYAHHPTEVAAVLAAARAAVAYQPDSSLEPGQVHAVFQPHLFSRTQSFAAEFGAALEAADTALVLDIYPAREEPIEGVTAELLGHPVHSPDSAVSAVAAVARPGDIILTIGAGDVTHLGAGIVQALRERIGG